MIAISVKSRSDIIKLLQNKYDEDWKKFWEKRLVGNNPEDLFESFFDHFIGRKFIDDDVVTFLNKDAIANYYSRKGTIYYIEFGELFVWIPNEEAVRWFFPEFERRGEND